MMSNLKLRWAALALATGVGTFVAGSVLTASASVSTPASVEWAPYAVGLNRPIDIAFTGVETDTRLFVAERDGRIRVVLDAGTVLTTPFLDIDDVVDGEANPEVGLFGITFDPNYADNGALYVYYNDLNGDLQLSRYQVGPDPNVALTTEVKLLTISHPDPSLHNGGDLNWGADGYLYLAPGDGGVSATAQALDTYLGKLLRIDVSGQPTYTVPASNPYTQTAGALPEIWASGLRNPWRFSFDQLTGDLYLGDVGEGHWEEIDRQLAASPGGENYGWPCYEGAHQLDPSPSCQITGVTMPIFEYERTTSRSVTGGFVYRGTAAPKLSGYYLFADFVTGQFFALATGSGAVVALGPLLGPGAHPVTFGQDGYGEIYLSDYITGTIFKLAALSALQLSVYLPVVSN